MEREEIDELQIELRDSWVELARDLNDEVARIAGAGESIPRDLVLNLNQVQSHIDRIDKQLRATPVDDVAESDDPLGGLKLHEAG